MLNSGMVTKTIAEIPYQGLQVAYNEGFTTAGIKFSGSTDEEYAYYFDHNGKSQTEVPARGPSSTRSGPVRPGRMQAPRPLHNG